MLREIIKIDEEKCNGCGNCVPGCPEGALQIIDGKARLISDLFCDGLGACLGECPLGAITIEKREAEKYEEKTVMKNIIKQGPNVIKAHLKHLLDHGEKEYYNSACEVLEENNIPVPMDLETAGCQSSGCPGSRTLDNRGLQNKNTDFSGEAPSELRQWPIQLHLLSPQATYFRKADLLLAADCTAFALGAFHSKLLKNKALAIACPKLDTGQEQYIQKISALLDDAEINTITVVMMQVPCCGGLLRLVTEAQKTAKRKVPVKSVIISITGEIIKEDWV
ncbi:MAG: 4Fe-4S ferredoxin [Spirochaetes bacterium GWF1_41_5]|nr:MAG: 4Fe-4S ferredoxin [Spirochaetes bacterium GWF1_41_5]